MFGFLAQQSEYGLMWALVILLIVLGLLGVAVPRFRRVDLLTDAEKKKQARLSGSQAKSGPGGKGTGPGRLNASKTAPGKR